IGERVFDLLHEQRLSTDGRERNVEDLVPRRLDDHELDLETRLDLLQERAHVLRLPERELRTARRDLHGAFPRDRAASASGSASSAGASSSANSSRTSGASSSARDSPFSACVGACSSLLTIALAIASTERRARGSTSGSCDSVRSASAR